MVRPLGSCRALRSISLCLCAVVALVCAPAALAQDVPPSDAQAPAHISFVDGVAVLERDGRTDDAPGSMPLLAGDRVRTRGGRVEILFADGSTLHLDHNSAVDLQSDELVRLIEGRIRLSIPGPARSVAYRIDGPHGWAQITEPGEYRVALMNGSGGSELELAVIRGRAELANDGGQTSLRAGERAFARAGAAPSYAYVANSAALDAFDRWSENRRDERMAASAEYLPDEVRPYAASLERHGYWRDEPTYGRVWYPRVEHDWRPYYRGRWVSLRPYGWTWVAYDPWGWPTHHYGRWGYSSAGAWFWIPGRTWGAAWVSWAYAPGYVSWCPLGWNNRPIFAININVRSGYDPWRAWTVIPQRHFGYGYVHRNVVRGSYIDHGTRSAFVHRDRAPEIQGHAVPRGAAPIRVAGTGPSRRGSSPLYSNLPADQGRIRTDGARIRVPDGSATGSRERAAPGGVTGDRAVPARPAVRSQRAGDPEAGRPADSDGRRPSSVRTVESPRGAGTSDARGIEVRRSEAPRIDAPRAEAPRTVPRADAPGRRRTASPGAVDRESSEAGRNDNPAAYRRTPEVQQERPRSRPDSPPVYEPRYEPRDRAVPRGEGRRPSGEARPSSPAERRGSGPVERSGPPPAERAAPPPAERRGSPAAERGPDRAPAGSYERRAPASAQPSAPPSGGRSAAPPAGARPRPSGEAPRGGAVRKPGGGR